MPITFILGILLGIFFAIIFGAGIQELSSIGALNEPAAQVFMQELFKLLGVLGWPVAVIMLMKLAQSEVRSIFAAFAKKIGDPKATVEASIAGSILKIIPGVEKAPITAEYLSNDTIQEKINTWLHQNAPEVTFTEIVYASQYTTLKNRAFRELGLPSDHT